jgi:hypothetical protein
MAFFDVDGSWGERYELRTRCIIAARLSREAQRRNKTVSTQSSLTEGLTSLAQKIEKKKRLMLFATGYDGISSI